ncbi:MAG: YgjV family protein [Alphaproteobacteria bacterium]|nr:YgjV family protein [Alphaproteobacteria bacterium]
MLSVNLIVGNIFSFCCAVCIAISVIKRNKKNLIWWQIWDSTFEMLTSLVLLSYAGCITGALCTFRNIFAYKKGLTKFITWALVAACLVVGLSLNNRGIFGIMPIAAFTFYTLAMYWTKDEQQMRYAVVGNLLLWFIHDFYIQSYPSAIMDLVLSAWSFYQAMRHIQRKRQTRKSLTLPMPQTTQTPLEV